MAAEASFPSPPPPLRQCHLRAPSPEGRTDVVASRGGAEGGSAGMWAGRRGGRCGFPFASSGGSSSSERLRLLVLLSRLSFFPRAGLSPRPAKAPRLRGPRSLPRPRLSLRGMMKT
ncbi:Hypothetical predicted protein [Podarcis lilfordi]|uniref:Uncharacterized protein n=1 Tax=Podarcis lilfordi TaxID=74358 RepID=A0AA35NVE4_9SAUR|nr:Hypothetical predicted protein [Podarcis lilfordi]